MPMMPVYVTLSASGVSRVVNLDYNSKSPFNASVSVAYVSTSMTATYGVEYTMDDANLLSIQGSTRAVVWRPDANMPAGTSSGATTSYTSPIAAVRMTLTAVSSGSAVLQVLQG